MNKKILTTGIIILFLGLAFAPSLHANAPEEVLDGELVEITTEVCGLPGQKPQTVQLTTEDAEAVDKLFEEIKTKLDNIESREEAVKIFNEAIVELDQYGLLGGLSIEQAKRLVTSRYQQQRLSSMPMDENENRFCLIMGKTSWIWIFSFIPYCLNILFSMISDNGYIGLLVSQALIAISDVLPIDFFNIICFGNYIWESPYYNEGRYRPSEGWIWTFGIRGVQEVDGCFYGNLPLPPCKFDIPSIHPIWEYVYPGAVGFTGIHIFHRIIDYDTFFIGTSLNVKISSEPP
jgi:hypothetical protein